MKFTFLILLLALNTQCDKEKTPSNTEPTENLEPNIGENGGGEGSGEFGENGGGEGSGEVFEEELTDSIDISKFKAFALGNAASASLRLRDENKDQKLYGVKENGDVAEVLMTKSKRPALIRRIYDMKLYTIFVINSILRNKENKNCPQVILEKSTGKLYCLDSVEIKELSDFLAASFPWSPVQEDESGRLMAFLGNRNQYNYPNLYRLDMTGDIPKVILVHEGNGYISEFSMNGSGEVLYKYYDNYSNHNGRVLRVSTPDGGFRPAGDSNHTKCFTFGKVEERDIFYVVEGLAGASSGVTEIFLENNIISRNNTFEYNGSVGDETWDYRCNFPLTHKNNFYFVGNREKRVSGSNHGPKVISLLKYDPVEKTGKLIDLAGTMTTPRKAIAYDKHIVVVGEDELGNSSMVTLNIETEESKVIIPPGLFVFKRFSKNNDSAKFIFSAQRTRDSALIQGSLDIGSSPIENDSQVETLNVKLPEVTELIPLRN